MAESKSRPLPFVRLTYTANRTPTGRRTATPARKAARYFAYANDLEAERSGQQRGHWYGPDGSKHEHEPVLAWAAAGAKAHHYTFQALLSLPEGRLSAEDFTRAMREGKYIDDFRLIPHDDTEHSHAHVLFFRDSRMDKEQFTDWHERIRQSLAAREGATLQARELSTVAQLSQEERYEELVAETGSMQAGERAATLAMDAGLDLI